MNSNRLAWVLILWCAFVLGLATLVGVWAGSYASASAAAVLPPVGATTTHTPTAFPTHINTPTITVTSTCCGNIAPVTTMAACTIPDTYHYEFTTSINCSYHPWVWFDFFFQVSESASNWTTLDQVTTEQWRVPHTYIGDFYEPAIPSQYLYYRVWGRAYWNDCYSFHIYDAYTASALLCRSQTSTPTETFINTPTVTPTYTHTPTLPPITPTPTPTPTCLPSWEVVPSANPNADKNELYGVSAVSANDVWAVGVVGNSRQTLVEHWDGGQWTHVPSPNGPYNNSNLLAVEAVAANDVWAVGYHGFADGEQTLIEHWNGTQWSVVSSPSATGGNFLHSVSAASANDVWAVGFQTIYPTLPAHTLIEHWNGTNWSIVPSPNLTLSDYLRGVAAVSANDVWAVGQTGSQTLIQHWNGSAWSIVPSPGVGSLQALSVISANDVWAVGYEGTFSEPQPLVEHWNGSAWNVVPLPTFETRNRLYSVAALSPSNVWAVGSAPGARALIIHWDGAQWGTVPSPSPGTDGSSLWGMTAVSANDVWAAGYRWDGGIATQTLIERYTGGCLTATSTATPIRTAIHTNTPVVTNTHIPTCTFTPTYTPTITPTRTRTPPPTLTGVTRNTDIPRTPAPSATYTPTSTITPTFTPTITGTRPTETSTRTPTRTPLPPTHTRPHSPQPSSPAHSPSTRDSRAAVSACSCRAARPVGARSLPTLIPASTRLSRLTLPTRPTSG